MPRLVPLPEHVWRLPDGTVEDASSLSGEAEACIAAYDALPASERVALTPAQVAQAETYGFRSLTRSWDLQSLDVKSRVVIGWLARREQLGAAAFGFTPRPMREVVNRAFR